MLGMPKGARNKFILKKINNMKTSHVALSMIIMFCFALMGCQDSGKHSTSHSDSQHKADSSGASHNSGSSNHSDLMKSMKSMEDKMRLMKITGDMDIDFATLMIDHHQGAIEMAKVQVQKGKNEQLKAMAQNMIDAQSREINAMQNILAGLKRDSLKKSDGHDHLGDAMREMMTKMRGMKMTGDIDQDFAAIMIPHHESAIKMAENQISHGSNFELKKLSQKMMEDQRKEIEQLRKFVAK
jgi:uncharacterized protein (DUF305 family)